MTITPEDWEAWRSHPVTEAVMAALLRVAENNKQAWTNGTWGLQPVSQEVRDRLYVCANCYIETANMTLNDLLILTGEKT